MSVKEAYNSEWKEKVRTRIKRSDGVIALISKNSLASTGQKWEIACAKEERKPIRGIRAYTDDKTELDGVYTMDTKFGDYPADPTVVPENYGHWVFVLRGTHFADTQQYKNACTWGYGKLNVTGARMEWTFTDGGGIAPSGAVNKPGEFFVFGWSLYRDTLTLTPVPGKISPAAWMRLRRRGLANGGIATLHVADTRR